MTNFVQGDRNQVIHRPLPTPNGQAGLAALRALIANRSPLDSLQALHRELGDVFQLSLGSFNPVVMAGPEASHFVLVEARDSLLWRPPQDPVAKLLRQGLLMTDGAQHQELRRRQFPPLHKRQVETYLDVFLDATDQISQGWSLTEPVEMLSEMRKLALIILCRALFAYDPTDDLEQLVPNIVKVIRYISPGTWLVADWLPRPGNRSAIDWIDDFLYSMIDQRAQNPEGDDLLGRLLQHQSMDRELIRDQLLTMLIAGHDTSTAHLAWTLYLLAQNPQITRRAAAEVDRVVGSNPPTLESLDQLILLDRILKESLRLYPPIHIGNRMVAEDLEFQGYHIPKGARLVYSIYLTHRHPGHWQDPDRFDPDRFDPERSAERPSYAYLPFGGGPRNCIGTSFAQLEAKAVITRILQSFTLGAVSHPVHKHMGATLEPSPGVHIPIVSRR